MSAGFREAIMVVDLWIEVFALSLGAFLIGLISSWLIWNLGKVID